MAHWYETPPSGRSHAQKERARMAYRAGLLQTQLAREMLYDMRRRVSERIGGSEHTAELAVAQIWLEAFVANSLILAGVQDEMAIIEALDGIAAAYTPEKSKPNLPEDHRE